MKSHCDCHSKYQHIYKVVEAPAHFADRTFYYCDKGYQRHLKNRLNWKRKQR